MGAQAIGMTSPGISRAAVRAAARVEWVSSKIWNPSAVPLAAFPMAPRTAAMMIRVKLGVHSFLYGNRAENPEVFSLWDECPASYP